MLAGVLLHMVEASGPVDLSSDLRAVFHKVITNVENDPVFLMYVQHMDHAAGGT